MNRSRLKFTLLLTLGILFFGHSANAQVNENSELFLTLKTKDSLLFEVAFNECNLAIMESLLPEDFEFYHDKEGITQTRTAFITSIETNLCSTGKNPTKRVLTEGSMEIFPLYDNGKLYGAFQTGKHSFGNVAARFTHFWRLINGEWVPTHMMSYDHQIKAPTVITDVVFIELTDEEMRIYLGDYRFSDDFTLTILLEGGKMYGNAQGQKVELNPIGNHQFLDQSQTMKLTFLTNDTGKTSRLEVSGANGTMKGDKVN